MTLKRKIKKDEFEKLPEVLQEFYLEDDKGDYGLDVDLGDIDKLERAKIRETQKRKEFQQELEAARKRLAELEENEALANGDIKTLQKGWNDERAKMQSEFESQLAAKTQFIERTLIENTSMQFANELFKNPNRDLLHIKNRISVDMSDGDPKIVILGKDGKPSDLDFNGLKKEFIDNSDFSDIIIGSKATGGGTAGDKPTQTVRDSFGSETKPNLAAMSSSERLAYFKSVGKGVDK